MFIPMRYKSTFKLVKFCIGLVIISIAMILLFMTVKGLDDIVFKPFRVRTELLSEINSLRNEINQLEETKNSLNTEADELEKICITYTKDISNLQTIEVDNLKKYYSLYDKYSYAVDYRKKDSRSDFGLQELVYQDSISNKTGAPTALMLALYEVESGLNSMAKNSTSTATGYGQLIDSSAKMVYEKMLSRGTYDRSKHRYLSTNKKLNMDMATAYIARNIEVYGGARRAVEAYYGHPDSAERARYSSLINSKLKSYGYTLDNVCSQ